MQLETFRGPDLAFVVKQVRHALGADAMIVRSDRVHNGSIELVEVLAARPEDIDAFSKKLDGGRAAALRAKDRRRVGPYTVAFVGPAGGGKTTTAIKVALSPAGVAGRRIGLITLDTHRVGGIEELQTYAEITKLPLEVLYSPADVPDALTRLAGMDVILVDTPGRAPGGMSTAGTPRSALWTRTRCTSFCRRGSERRRPVDGFAAGRHWPDARPADQTGRGARASRCRGTRGVHRSAHEVGGRWARHSGRARVGTRAGARGAGHARARDERRCPPCRLTGAP